MHLFLYAGTNNWMCCIHSNVSDWSVVGWLYCVAIKIKFNDFIIPVQQQQYCMVVLALCILRAALCTGMCIECSAVWSKLDMTRANSSSCIRPRKSTTIYNDNNNNNKIKFYSFLNGSQSYTHPIDFFVPIPCAHHFSLFCQNCVILNALCSGIRMQ